MDKKGDIGDYSMYFVFAFLMFIIAGGIAMGVFAFLEEVMGLIMQNREFCF